METIENSLEKKEESISYDELKEMMYKLGTQGIILPSQITYGDLVDILYTAHQMFKGDHLYKSMQSEHPELTKEDFSRYAQNYLYTQLYEMNDKKYYQSMKEYLISSKECEKNSSEHIRQCFFAFEQGQYFICACGLLTILEGILAGYAQSSNTRLSSLFKRIEEEIVENQDTDQILAAANMRGYIELLTAKSDFQGGIEPNELNRHWLLHGRSQRTVEKADCLRLFITVSIILEISQLGLGDTP